MFAGQSVRGSMADLLHLYQEYLNAMSALGSKAACNAQRDGQVKIANLAMYSSRRSLKFT